MTDYLYSVVQRLVSFDTVSSHSNLPAIEYLSAELRAHHFKTSLQEIEIDGIRQANLAAWIGPPTSGGLIMSGHVDTVPFEGQPGWTRDPLALTRDGDRIFGRGTTDMKGFIAECLDAAGQLDYERLKRPLVFLFTANEEVGCLGAKALAPALRELLGDVPVPEFAWIGEPTSWRLSHAHKSIVLFDVTVRGRGGHSGAPAAGVNAIAVMGRVIEALGRLQEERRNSASAEFGRIFPEAPYDVLNFGAVTGGIALNMIAEECVLRISYRSMPNVDPLELYREAKLRIRALDRHDYASHSTAASIELSEPMVVPPLNSPRATPLEAALLEATGERDSGGVLFGTDGGWFSQSGVTSIICGPGDMDQAHQPNECIRRDNFERGIALILKVVDRMCC